MEEDNHKKKSNFKIITIVSLAIFILVLVIATYSSSDNNVSLPTSDMPVSDTQGFLDSILPEAKPRVCYDEQIPYQVEEQYIDQESYQETEYYDIYLNAQVINQYTEKRTNFDYGAYAYSYIELLNVDDEPAWFTITYYWETLEDNEQNIERHYINPDQTVIFEKIYDIDSGEDYKVSFNYVSDPIQKSRQVTKYRDVIKTRQVTEYRTEERCE